MLLSGLQKLTLLDYPSKLAAIIFTVGCNMRCGYCHNSQFVLPDKIKKLKDSWIVEGVFFRFLQTRRGLLDGVVICGGEPTIHPDLPVFCRKIKDLWFLVKLDTNGSNPEMINILLEQNLVDYIAMDIKTSFEKYRELTWVDIAPSLYKESIQLIMERAPQYEFRTTLIRRVHSLEDVRDMAQSIRGSTHYYLQNYRWGNTLDPDFQWESFSHGNLEAFRSVAAEYVLHCSIRT